MQLTHSLKAPGFNPSAYEVKNRFQSLVCFPKFNFIPLHHGARGLSQEKALVSGLKAADAAADGARRAGRLGASARTGAAPAGAAVGGGVGVGVGRPSVIRQTDEDEPHVVGDCTS